MKTQNSIYAALPVLFGFFVMGFCDIVGISSDYVQRTFDWSPVMTGFVPSLVLSGSCFRYSCWKSDEQMGT